MNNKFHPSVYSTIEELINNYPGIKLVSVAQTVFWDEPVKALLHRILDLLAPEVSMLLLIHDADYVSNLTRLISESEGEYSIVSHNDGTTQGLWAAVGEISQLFGSEVVPTRELLIRYGVPLKKLAFWSSERPENFLNQVTEAWGWRTLIPSRKPRILAADIFLCTILPYLFQILDWAWKETINSLVSVFDQKRAWEKTTEIRGWINNYFSSHPQATLTQLYQALLPLFYQEILGYSPSKLEVSSTTQWLRFNRETCRLPRFRLLEKFLHPSTRGICCQAYNQAIRDSGIYLLEEFGEGALPFDLVIPGQGRGTLRIIDKKVVIEMEDPVFLATFRPVEDVDQLAQLVEERWGKDVFLIGKAITFISMLAQESILVLNESASPYIHRTKIMLEMLRKNGVVLFHYPLLRLRYHTLDAAEQLKLMVKLPEHLAECFSKKEISFQEFSRFWKGVVEEQGKILDQIQKLKGRRWFAFLSEKKGGEWQKRFNHYQEVCHQLREFGEESKKMTKKIYHCQKEIQQLEDEIQKLEVKRGQHHRLILRIHQLQNRIAKIKENYRYWKNGPKLQSLRCLRQDLEYKAEIARLHIVRNALLVYYGLPYINLRPTAWWFLLLSPGGEWFSNLLERIELYWEELNFSKIGFNSVISKRERS